MTLVDIGREAGVSFSTVSRVLRDRKDRIPEDTRRKVMAAATRLGYRRNLLIRGIQTGRSMNIGVVIPSTGSYYSQIVHGIHDEFRTHQYCILLAWNPEDTSEPDSALERDLIHSLVDRRVDGIILRPTHFGVSDVYFSEVLQRRIPMVTVDRPLPGVRCDFAGTDDEAGARIATRHLIEAGHRRLLHLSVVSVFAPAMLRRRGFEETCAGIPGVESHTVVIEQDGNHMLAVEQVLKVLAGPSRPTGLFLANDHLAPAVYQAAKALGLRIPGDLSVIGFGNIEKGEFADPPLTSVDQHPYQMGRSAAQMILSRVRSPGGEVASVLVLLRERVQDLVEHPEVFARWKHGLLREVVQYRQSFVLEISWPGPDGLV